MARRKTKTTSRKPKPPSKPKPATDEKPVEMAPDETTPPDPGPPAESEHEAPTVEVPAQPGLEHEAPTVEVPAQPELLGATAPIIPPAPAIPPPPPPEPEPEPELEAVEPPPPPTPKELIARACAKFPRSYDLDMFTGPLAMRPEAHLVKNAPPLWRDRGALIVSYTVFVKLPDYVQERLVKHASVHMAGIVVVVPRSYGVDKLRDLMQKYYTDGGAVRLEHYIVGASSATTFLTESELHTELKKWLTETEEDVARVKADLAASR